MQKYEASAGDLFYFRSDGRFVLLPRGRALDVAVGPLGWQAYSLPSEITISRPVEQQPDQAPSDMLENKSFARTSSPMEHLAFSTAGIVLAGGSSNGSLTVWEIGSGQVRQMPQPAGITSLAFSPDGAILAVGIGTPTAKETGTIRLLDYPTGGLRAEFGSSPGTAIAFSPDGTLFAGFEDGSWAVRRTTGVVTSVADSSRAAVTSLALHPAGGVVAVAHRDKRVDLWEIASGRRIVTLMSEIPASTLFPRAIERVAFNTTGTQIAAAYSDGEMRLWDCAVLNPRKE